MSLSRRALLSACCAALFGCGDTRGATADGDAPDLGTTTPALATASTAEVTRPPLAGSSGSATAVTPSVPEAPPPCPEGMARVDRSCVDRYEAHLVTRRAHGERERHPYFLRPEEGVVYEARSEPGVFPQAYISRVESEAACAEAGKRLCTRKEWQRACGYQGKGQAVSTYPYGNRWQPKRCNAEKAHLLTLRFGADSSRWRYAEFNDPALSQEPDFLARSGAYDGCVGEAGVYDMVGNLHEWVSDTATTAFEAQLRGEGVPRSFQYWSPGNAVFMGGFYSTHAELGAGCSFTTVAHDARYHDYSTGFRCCADAAPER